MRYFDCNATTPLCPQAREAWLEAQVRYWENPSSPYREAARVALRLKGAREYFAQVLGCGVEEIVFCSGATEAHNAFFRHAAKLYPEGKVLCSAVEHPSVLEAIRHYFAERVVEISVSEQGVVSLEEVESLIETHEPVLCAVMAANNETGVLQPWRDIATLCRDRRVGFFCDAVQWLGKMPAEGIAQCDVFSLCAHKFGGPKGVGVLRVSGDFSGLKMAYGGAQEYGRRGGTENVPAILAMEAAFREREKGSPQAALRDGFERELEAAVAGVQILGKGSPRLWNTAHLKMPCGDQMRWVSLLEKEGFCVSTGSACATGKAGPSQVLSAMGVEAQAQRRVIRVSSAPEHTQADWQALLAAIVRVYGELSASGSPANVIDIDEL